MICTYVGQNFIAAPILSEIKELSASDCDLLGVKLVEPELDEVLIASNERRGERINIVWGIELICMLVEAGGFPKKDAKAVILRIKQNNQRTFGKSIRQRGCVWEYIDVIFTVQYNKFVLNNNTNFTEGVFSYRTKYFNGGTNSLVP